jgi:hypothetical protein
MISSSSILIAFVTMLLIISFLCVFLYIHFILEIPCANDVMPSQMLMTIISNPICLGSMFGNV